MFAISAPKNCKVTITEDKDYYDIMGETVYFVEITKCGQFVNTRYFCRQCVAHFHHVWKLMKKNSVCNFIIGVLK